MRARGRLREVNYVAECVATYLRGKDAIAVVSFVTPTMNLDPYNNQSGSAYVPLESFALNGGNPFQQLVAYLKWLCNGRRLGFGTRAYQTRKRQEGRNASKRTCAFFRGV
jgi:hypothetical protein